MFTAIDHLVIVVSELEAAIHDYTAAGFRVIRGGRHSIGTHNALVAFADGSYLELIAFLEPAITGNSVASGPAALAGDWRGALAKGGGIVDFCVQTDDLTADAVAMRQACVTIGWPSRMTRDRPDGYRLEWQLSIPSPPYTGRVPFLIEDETPRDERVPRERSHSNRIAGLKTLSIAVEDPLATSVSYTRVLGRLGTPVQRPDLDGAGVSFRIGPHAVELIAPVRAEGPLVDWIKRRGQSPYSATLTGPPSVRLEPTLLCGARLFIA